MKKTGLLVSIILLAGIFNGCTAIWPQNSAIDAGETAVKTEAYFCLQASVENTGLGSANVWLRLVDEGTVWEWSPPYRILSLNQFASYHEFNGWEDGLRFVFTTETPVHDFRLFGIMRNENFGGEGERRFSIIDIFYVLDELTPEMPFVISGVDFGVRLPVTGFSFIDLDGETKYFTLGISNRDGNIEICEF
ncbi:MAG: hypothetical protein FWG66_00445 [Spirochaetes bacterium]|nr:hypothetical protein [Spirochaetota bacterium]